MHMTKGKMLQNIMVSLGGRIAEEIIFDDITTGASQDIKQATSIARAMVTEYGMSDKVGMINYGGDSNEVFIGRVRRDESVESGVNIWVVADNIRKGAATNAVQIAEEIIKNMQ